MSDQIEASDVPAEIMAAAEKVKLWAETNSLKYWQLGGICDRRFAEAMHPAGSAAGWIRDNRERRIREWYDANGRMCLWMVAEALPTHRNPDEHPFGHYPDAKPPNAPCEQLGESIKP